MNRLLIISTLSISVLILSCAGNKQDETVDNPEVSNESVVVQEETPVAQPEEIAIEQEQPEVMAQPEQSKNVAGLKINPPHGEPGHRCDVNVGDPLPDNNSPTGVSVQSPAPQNMQAPQVQSPSSIMNQSAPVPAATAPAATAAGMNPPHGEPGHDCAVPVGAPLKK